MKIDITTTRENPLIGRKEVAFKVVEPSTPRRAAIRRELAKTMQTDIEKVYVRKLETKTGTRLTLGEAHIYDEIERGLEVEPEYIIARNRIDENEEEPQEIEQEQEEDE